MSERNRAARFDECLTALLSGGTCEIQTAPDPRDQAVLSLALELHGLDLADGSIVREGLGQALRGIRRAPRSIAPKRSPRRRGRRAAVAAAMVLLAMGALTLASPRLRAAVADTLDSWFGRRVVMHSINEGVDSLTAFWSQVDEGSYWSLSTTYGAAEGFVTRGMKPYSRQYAGLSALAKDARIAVLAPTAWPEHLPAFLRFQRGWLNPDGSVWLEFCTGPWEFALSQTPIGASSTEIPTFVAAWHDTTAANPGAETGTMIWGGIEVSWMPTDEEVRRATYRWARPRREGEPAYGALHWEGNGIRYVLSGQNLTRAWAEEIWRSLRVVKR